MTHSIIAQSTDTMDMLDVDYSDDKHVLAYDNSTAPEALNAFNER
jgi:hypothetical protein